MKNCFSILSLTGFIFFISCNGGKENANKLSIQKIVTTEDSVRQLIEEQDSVFQAQITKTNLLLDEKNLKENTGLHEFRFYLYRPKFVGPFTFIKVNFKDSILYIKEFDERFPEMGEGKDTIYLSKSIKLSREEIRKLNYLIEYSMFWSLEPIAERNYILDGSTIIYEARQPNVRKFCPFLRTYHHVTRYACHNSDFENLAGFLMKKTRE